MNSDQKESGFTLLEMMISLLIMSVLSAISLPVFVRTMDRADLWETASTIVTDLRVQQVRALAVQNFQEVRFAPFANQYGLFGGDTGFRQERFFAQGVHYEDGYLHLPEPTVRFSSSGSISESGQIGLIDQEGDVLTITLCLGSGDLRFSRGLYGSSI